VLYSRCCRKDRKAGVEMRKWLLTICWLLAVPAWSQTIAVRAGNLINPSNGTVSKEQVILIKGGNIEAVGHGLRNTQGCRNR
jgi:hypothetical protein